MGQVAVVLFESSRGGIMKTDQKSKSQKALSLPFELLLMETRYGCVSFCIFSGPCAARRSIYALGALCEVCDER